MDLQSILSFLQSNGPELVGAGLAVLGGLKIIARYTPWEFDDKALEIAEKPFQFIAGLLKRSK